MRFTLPSSGWQRSLSICLYSHPSCFLVTFRQLQAPSLSTLSRDTSQNNDEKSSKCYSATQESTEASFSATLSDQQDSALQAKPEASKRRTTRKIAFQRYPRIQHGENQLTCERFRLIYESLKDRETLSDIFARVRGRIASMRTLGRDLSFIDVIQDGHKVQILCDQQNVGGDETREEIGDHLSSLQRGDIIAIEGHPHRTARGELSIKATSLPEVLVPCLQAFPEHTHLRNQTTLSVENAPVQNNAELFTNPSRINDLRRRSAIIRGVRDFFRNRDFLEVETPILAGVAGGAIARAFETTASEFPDRKIALRIAPELWLKRLIVGGLERVFEIGPSFRNEGLDKTHNPEFRTCEFYATYTTLDELIALTKELIRNILPLSSNQELSTTPPKFRVVPFIPTLETTIGASLPPLHHPSATSALLEIFRAHSIRLPNPSTLPRLLDRLAAHFLEPAFSKPDYSLTFLTHHPVALSPLSKSYLDPETKQYVAPRAELYINGLEIANMYEEENDPRAQRQKLLQQAQWAAEGSASAASTAADLDAPSDGDLKIDEDYISALEWGLPPTGGWGCGIDRLVMILLGKERIADVLTFGGLRGLTKGAVRNA